MQAPDVTAPKVNSCPSALLGALITTETCGQMETKANKYFRLLVIRAVKSAV